MKSVMMYRDTKFFRIMELADTPYELAQGLLGRSSAGNGLLLMGANQIHTYGMKIPIDVVYLDGSGRVIGVQENLIPNREGQALTGTNHVVELNIWEILRNQIHIGEQWFWATLSYQ